MPAILCDPHIVTQTEPQLGSCGLDQLELQGAHPPDEACPARGWSLQVTGDKGAGSSSGLTQRLTRRLTRRRQIWSSISEMFCVLVHYLSEKKQRYLNAQKKTNNHNKTKQNKRLNAQQFKGQGGGSVSGVLTFCTRTQFQSPRVQNNKQINRGSIR